jgi:hypothetical protein
MEFILTIDTEGDNQWDHGRELTTENIKFVPRFQDLCDKYLIKPTYLVTSEVCEDPFAREIFSDYLLKDKAEIGAHLHSWTTPPYEDKEGYRFNDPNHAFANELPDDLLSRKIKNLTDQIESSFGRRPLSFLLIILIWLIHLLLRIQAGLFTRESLAALEDLILLIRNHFQQGSPFQMVRY